MPEPKTGFDLPTMKTLWLPSLLGFINCLPSTIVMSFYILVMVIAKQYRPARFKEYEPRTKIVSWTINLETVPGSKTESSAFWSAMSLGAYVVGNKIAQSVERERFTETFMHEQGHTIQQYVLGTLGPTVLTVLLVLSWFNPDWHMSAWCLLSWLTAQPVLYVLSTCFIWLFLKNNHAYYDNPFEIHARWFAEDDDVIIPKETWQRWNERRGKDKNDRFIWW